MFINTRKFFKDNQFAWDLLICWWYTWKFSLVWLAENKCNFYVTGVQSCNTEKPFFKKITLSTLVFAFFNFSCILLLQGKIMMITKIYVSSNHFWNCVSWCIWNQLSLSYQAPLTNIAWNYFANGVLGCHSYTAIQFPWPVSRRSKDV